MIRKSRIKSTGNFCLICFFSLCLSFFYVISCFAQNDEKQQRVFDQARLLSEQEVLQLEEEVHKISQQIKMDVVVVTTADAEGKSVREFADDFYIEGNFGAGSKYSGVLFLIDMEHREIYINAVGQMARILTDQRRELILDAVYPAISQEDYHQAISQFLSETAGYVKKGIESGQYNYDEVTGEISVYRRVTVIEFLAALIIAAIIAWLPCISIKRKYAMRESRKLSIGNQQAYTETAGFLFSQKQDQCLNTRVTQRHLPKPPSGGGKPGGGSASGRSTTHSSSGRTFSGSGRKF